MKTYQLEIASAPESAAPAGCLHVVAGVAESPDPLPVEALQAVGDIDATGPVVLHPQPERMIVARHYVDEGR